VRVDYIDFVEVVLQALLRLVGSSTDMVGRHEIANVLGIGGDDAGMLNALDDLATIGVGDPDSGYQWVRPTERSELIRHGAAILRDLWPPIFNVFLPAEQEVVLAKAVEMAHQPGSSTADVGQLELADVYAALSWSMDGPDALDVANVLKGAGFAEVWAFGRDSITIRPRYAGVVRATQRLATEWQQRLKSILAEGETTTVDIKQELSVKSEPQKGEFVRDVLGLATTKASGRERYLVIGYDDTTLEFVKSVDPALSRNQLEQIINAYTEPKPDINWVTIPVIGGTAGLVVVTRDPAKVPYRVAKAIWKLKLPNVYVRHGTQTEKPTRDELKGLEAEGKRARGQ
jgi:hypothetical protein